MKDLGASGDMKSKNSRVKFHDEHRLTYRDEVNLETDDDLDVISDICLRSNRLHLEAVNVQNQILGLPLTESRKKQMVLAASKERSRSGPSVRARERYMKRPGLKLKIIGSLSKIAESKSHKKGIQISGAAGAKEYFSENSFPLFLSKEKYHLFPTHPPILAPTYLYSIVQFNLQDAYNH